MAAISALMRLFINISVMSAFVQKRTSRLSEIFRDKGLICSALRTDI